MLFASGFLNKFKGDKEFVATENATQAPLTAQPRTVLDRLIGRTRLERNEQGAAPAEPKTPDHLLAGIAFAETSIVPEAERYSFRKHSGSKEMGDDIGKYQVTEGELTSYAPLFLGRSVTADEFAASGDLQEEYMENKIALLREDGLTDEEIAAFHRAGLTGWGDPEVRKKKTADRADYVKRVLEGLGSTDG